MNETRRIPLNVHHFVRDGMDRTDAGLLEIEELNEMVNDALTDGDRKRAGTTVGREGVGPIRGYGEQKPRRERG